MQTPSFHIQQCVNWDQFKIIVNKKSFYQQGLRAASFFRPDLKIWGYQTPDFIKCILIQILETYHHHHKSMTQLDQCALKARNKLVAMFLLLFAIDATLVFMAQDRWAIGRILLTIVVMYFVLQGRSWAKWLLMSICSLVFVVLITMVVGLSSKLSTTLVVGSLIMAVLSAIIPIYMATNKDLNRYFIYKRQTYSQSP
ncbi:hypothetical protein [Argonema antarcticum]|uniref:hypothetical protein n=1 Tax=Argonema antarcticum TaxID=2942763 RepID=UPI00201399B8|nr:hypothetical protein [Argonema antarcticum]